MLDYFSGGRSNRCFILVEYHYSYGGLSWVNHMSLWDVHENSQYADFSETHMVYDKPQFKTENLLGKCEVQDKKCKTVDEFNNLVHSYLSD